MLVKKKSSRMLGSFATVAGLMLGSFGVTVGTATPASADGWIRLFNDATGMCMHASSGGGPGAWVTQELCNQDERGQLWAYATDTSNRMTLRSFDWGLCLDGYNGNNPGTVIVWPCNQGASQAWTLTSNQSFKNVGSGKVIEPPGQSANAGNQLLVWPENGSRYQKWWQLG
ncbi:RICIN domain-containing protein [Streptomyces sp. NPDC055254]